MQGNKFSGAPPGLNWVRRRNPRTKLCLLMASFVMVLLPESPGAPISGRRAARDWLALACAGLLVAGCITLHLLHWDRIPGLGILTRTPCRI
jgi:energy-coupling factor transporter transmembrane protein EcfT